MLKLVRLFLRSPILSLVASFFILIAVGTVFLLLPWSAPSDISFIDALFTATSAATVTGLVVKSTAGDFTLFGQIVILALIQIGAIGIMTGAAFFFLLLKKGIGLGYLKNLRLGFEQEYAGEVLSTVKFIVISTLVFEVIGAAALFFAWQGGMREEDVLFSSVFHSVSAFGNAGFSLFDNSLDSYRGNFAVNSIFSFLIISGGLGFVVLKDFWRGVLFQLCKAKSGGAVVEPKFRFSLHSKLVLWGSLVLIILGAALFYFFERSNPMFSSSWELLLASFFQSITARTAGFSTVPVSELSSATLFSLMVLMFIGGAPGSTAGGAKITTIILAFLGIRALVLGRQEVTVFRRSVPADIIRRALVSIFLLLFIVSVFAVLLLYFEKGSFASLLFEVFSAFGTVGLSAGATSNLTMAGKLIIILLMFVGRLVPLTLAIIGGRKLVWQGSVRYPEERINLG